MLRIVRKLEVVLLLTRLLSLLLITKGVKTSRLIYAVSMEYRCERRTGTVDSNVLQKHRLEANRLLN